MRSRASTDGRRRWAAATPLTTVASLGLLAALAVDVASPGLAPPPGPSVQGEALARRPHRVAGRYELRAQLDPTTHGIAGEGVIELLNTSRAPLDHLFVHLYLNAFESDKTVFQRGPAGGFRGGGAGQGGRIDVRRLAVPAWGDEDLWPHGATSPGHPDDRTDIRVPLPRSIAPGETVRFAIAWDAVLPPVTLRTGWEGSFHMAGQWFPKLAKLEADGTFAHFPFERLSEFYADFADWDVRIVTPPGFVVGATGRQVEEIERAGMLERRFVQEGVHDFAFAAWDRFEEVRAEHAGVSIRCLHPPGLRAAADLQIEVARRGLDHLGGRWGPYPYTSLTLIHPPAGAPEAGGMEYPTLVTTGGPWWGPVVGVRQVELVTIHELAHQWFQGIVATNEREHPFLDEGLTTFAEIDAMDHLAPEGSSLSMALGLRLDSEPWHRAFGIEPARRGAIMRPARDFTSGGEYGGLVYGRTAILLRTLDRVHDGAVTRALGTYARRHRFAHPTPDDLIAIVRAEVGDAAATALSQGLSERGWIDVSLESVSWRDAEGGAVEVEVVLARAGTIELPVDVEVVDDAGRVQRVRWDGEGSTGTVQLRLPRPPRFALVDPDHALLLDDDLLDGAWAARPPPPVAWRTFLASSAAARAALGLLAP